MPDSPCGQCVTTDGPERPGHGRDGRFLPGNKESLRHGLRSERWPAEYAGLQAEVERFVGGCISDDGGIGEIATRRRALIEYRARLHRRIQQLDVAIERHGLFDKRGKLRVAWLSQLQGLIATAKGLDSLLGLERRQRSVADLSLAEYCQLQEQQQAAQQALQAAADAEGMDGGAGGAGPGIDAWRACGDATDGNEDTDAQSGHATVDSDSPRGDESCD